MPCHGLFASYLMMMSASILLVSMTGRLMNMEQVQYELAGETEVLRENLA
jgi:hypothetical protein